MEKITIEQLEELYNDTLEKCGTYLLKEDDDTIAYNIFEEFDIGVHSFLHENSLDTLYENKLISENKRSQSVQLRKKVLALQNSNEWDIHFVRTSLKWKEIMLLCDELKLIA